MVFRRNPEVLLNLGTMQDIKVSGTFGDYHELLNKRLKYPHEPLQNFKSKRVAMIDKERAFFQYNIEDLVYIISPLTSQLCTAQRKVMFKYKGPVGIYKIIDAHNYLLMTLDGKIVRNLFEHERLKPAILRTSKGDVNNLSQLKLVINVGLTTLL